MKSPSTFLVVSMLLVLSGTIDAQTLSFSARSGADSGRTYIYLDMPDISEPTLDQDPVEIVEKEGSGSSDAQRTKISYGLPALSILTIDNLATESANLVNSTMATAEGTAVTSHVSMLGGLVEIEGLQVRSICKSTATENSCRGTTSVSRLLIAGKSIPAQSIEPGKEVAVVGLVPVNKGGVIVQVPVELKLLMNQQEMSDEDVDEKSIVVRGARLIGETHSEQGELDVDMTVGESRAMTAMPPSCSAVKLASNKYYQYPGDPRRAYKCDSLHEPRAITCAVGMKFNPTRQSCVWNSR